METIDNLQKFGRSYQAKVVASLLESQPFLNQVSDITKKDFFELEADRWIVGEIVSYNLNNNSAPTLDVFKVKLNEVETDAQKKMIVDRLQQVYDLFGSPDSDFIKQEYLKHLFGLQKVLRFKSLDDEFDGVIEGVNVNGELEINVSGKVRSFKNKEISFLL
jgi:hypothetical protein